MSYGYGELPPGTSRFVRPPPVASPNYSQPYPQPMQQLLPYSQNPGTPFSQVPIPNPQFIAPQQPPNYFHSIEQSYVNALRLESMKETWKDALKEEFKKPYFAELCEFVAGEYVAHPGKVFPQSSDIFNWTEHCHIEDVKVVVVGKDPYPTPGHAHGLAFSVHGYREERQLPSSMKNILKEVKNAFAHYKKPYQYPGHGDLTEWAKRGVLLLNCTLTYRQKVVYTRSGKRKIINAHIGHGWEDFTDEAIRCISSKNENVTFLLWGKDAQKKEHLIDQERGHTTEKCTHPSGYSAWRQGTTAGPSFDGSGHFRDFIFPVVYRYV